MMMDSSKPPVHSTFPGFQPMEQANNSLVAQFALAASNAAKTNFYSNPLLLSHLMKNQFPLPQTSPLKTELGRDYSVDSEKGGIEDGGANSGERSTRIQARLARNRTTARLRRERKKQQAENLTKLVGELRVELEVLEEYLDSMPQKAQMKIKAHLENGGSPPVACIFCDQDFKTEEAKQKHVLSDHATDLKARQALQQICSEELKRQIDPNNAANAKLSHEERRKRRLERNAASARLCRQRKKQYIENLRLQVPTLRHKVEALRTLLPKEAVDLVKLRLKDHVAVKAKMSIPEDKEMDFDLIDNNKPLVATKLDESALKKVSIPRLSGWDNSNRRNNHSSSQGYESGSSEGTAASVKDRSVLDVPRSPKRRRGSESVDIASASPTAQPFSLPMGFLNPGLTLPPLALNYNAALQGAVSAAASASAVNPPIDGTAQQPDIFSAAMALSNLGPISQKQT